VKRPIVFIHGAWVTPLSWEPFLGFFQDRGYDCTAPAWPGKDRPVDEIRRDPSALAGLGIARIAAHYERIVRAMPEPPFMVGHSYGGLIVQLLLDRGLGAAGVAIDSAPPKGVFAYEPTALASLGRLLLVPFGWRRVVRWSFREFRYAFVNALPPEVQRDAYDRYVVPESGRIFFESALALFTPRSPLRIDFARTARAPLLLIAGGRDHVVPAVINRRNFRAYRRSPARTDFREFPGRVHWIIAQDGWEEVAGFAADWLEGVAGSPAADAEGLDADAEGSAADAEG
jgi:pimeloyl-ACP methyl ester carboxylesterase